MARTAPDFRTEWNAILEKNADAEVWQSYSCELVTPMYGGGVEAGKVDAEMPIRASEIRGQLRFWWRIACCDASLSSQEMFKREVEIWGGIGSTGDKNEVQAKASKVEVRVICPKVTERHFKLSTSENDPGIKYAFGSAAINGEAKWLTDYKFTLQLRFPESVGDEVMAALRWWASFGGVGARTRRGFGAICIEDLLAVTPREVAKCKGQLLAIDEGGKAPDAKWKVAVNRLFAFRQKGGIGRVARNPTPSRSYWPEPDQIRRFTNRDAQGKHRPEHPANNVFPRAAFGLPITFEFKGSRGEPDKMELLPEGEYDRMASPLILRPYWDGSTWQAAALLLPNWQNALKQKLKFKDKSYVPAHWPENPVDQLAKAKVIKPMQKPSGGIRATDPLSAFMDFFERGV
jgi:CRISPR-associated protein Cmr1